MSQRNPNYFCVICKEAGTLINKKPVEGTPEEMQDHVSNMHGKEPFSEESLSLLASEVDYAIHYIATVGLRYYVKEKQVGDAYDPKWEKDFVPLP